MWKVQRQRGNFRDACTENQTGKLLNNLPVKLRLTWFELTNFIPSCYHIKFRNSHKVWVAFASTSPNSVFIYSFLGFPAVVVVISLTVTHANSYGNTAACWLDVKSGLIWAFIAPALLVILVSEHYVALSFIQNSKIYDSSHECHFSLNWGLLSSVTHAQVLDLNLKRCGCCY